MWKRLLKGKEVAARRRKAKQAFLASSRPGYRGLLNSTLREPVQDGSKRAHKVSRRTTDLDAPTLDRRRDHGHSNDNFGGVKRRREFAVDDSNVSPATKKPRVGTPKEPLHDEASRAPEPSILQLQRRNEELEDEVRELEDQVRRLTKEVKELAERPMITSSCQS